MSKQSRNQYKPLTLPAFERGVMYPPALSGFLQVLLNHRARGITTIELHQMGHVSVANYVSLLKKNGWLITTERTEVTDTNGKQRKGIALYKAIGCSVMFSEEVRQDA